MSNKKMVIAGYIIAALAIVLCCCSFIFLEFPGAYCENDSLGPHTLYRTINLKDLMFGDLAIMEGEKVVSRVSGGMNYGMIAMFSLAIAFIVVSVLELCTRKTLVSYILMAIAAGFLVSAFFAARTYGSDIVINSSKTISFKEFFKGYEGLQWSFLGKGSMGFFFTFCAGLMVQIGGTTLIDRGMKLKKEENK